jgi:hypothetical protein
MRENTNLDVLADRRKVELDGNPGRFEYRGATNSREFKQMRRFQPSVRSVA